MRHHLTLLLLASAAMPAAAWAQAAPDLRDFSLPPSPRETAAPEVQGPVDDSAPVPVAPRVIRTPEARATAAPQPRPALRLPEAQPSAAAPPAPGAAPAVQPRAAPQPSNPGTAGRQFAPDLPPSSSVQTSEPSSAAPLSQPQPSNPLPSLPQVATAEEAKPESENISPWLFIGLLGLATLAAGAWFVLRRRHAARPLTIERPLVASTKPAGNHERPDIAPANLTIELAAVKLTRSFMNASLAYRVTLRSRSSMALTGVAVAGELVAAHGSQPLENQIASAAADLPQLHRTERLAPGQAQTVEGTLTLPLSNVIPIRQGPAALFVPLLRLLVTAEGMEPLARTFVVGLPGQGMAGRLQPFRLDEPPRSYAPVGQRALD